LLNKTFVHLFHIVGSFLSSTLFSQGSVATRLRRSGIFNSVVEYLNTI